MDTITIQIIGMAGNGCTAKVRSALTAIRGVGSVEVSREAGVATVRYDPERVRPEQFKTAVRVMGFEAKLLC